MPKVHFRNLQSHRASVFQLYRSLLRNVNHLPLSQNDNSIVHGQIKSRFKDGRKLMAPSAVRRDLIEGYRWNSHMYHAILDTSQPPSSISLEWIKTQLKQYQADIERQEQFEKGKSINLNPPPTGDDLIKLQTTSRFVTMRYRMLRSYKNNCRVSKKSELDDTYVNGILIPEYFARKELRKTINLEKIQTSKPKEASIAFIPTLICPIYYLKYPYKRNSRGLHRIVTNMLHTKLFDKIDALEQAKILAQYEADWEAELEQNQQHRSIDRIGMMEWSKTRKKISNEWLRPLDESIAQTQSKVDNLRKREKLHARVLFSRKKMLNKTYEGKFRANLWKWKYHRQLKQNNQLPFMVHYDVHKMM